VSLADLIAFTDGGCRGNPGVGAWAFLLVEVRTGRALERAGGEQETTNNRMEISAVLEALRAIRTPNAAVSVVSDSRYVIGCATQWMADWRARGWRRKGAPLKNLDLIQELDALLPRHQVEFRWVAGHSGHGGNEHVDRLGNQAMDRLERGQDPTHERRFRWQGPLDEAQ
jgi:ribonuclease HI